MIEITQLDPNDAGKIELIAQWYQSEWGTPVDRTKQRLSEESSDDVYFQLILTLEGEVISTAGLCNQVNLLKVHPDYEHLGPWISLLYTSPEYRGRGYGAELLSEMEIQAKRIGLEKIYLYTFTAESLYARMGWIVIDRVIYKGHQTVIMEKWL